MFAGRLASLNVARTVSRASLSILGACNGGWDGLAGKGRGSIACRQSCEPSRFAPALTTDQSRVCAATLRADPAAHGLNDGSGLSPVNGRAPGSSEQLHRSGERKHGRSEPLTAPRQISLCAGGPGKLYPPGRLPPGEGGDDKGQSPLVLIFAVQGRVLRDKGEFLMSAWLANVTLGDLFALQLVLGLVQCLALGLIHGHQR